MEHKEDYIPPYSGWNYRIIRKWYPIGASDSFPRGGCALYHIHEVYYDDETGEARSYSLDGMRSSGRSISDLRKDLELIQQAFERPVLEIVGDIEDVQCLIEVKDEILHLDEKENNEREGLS